MKENNRKKLSNSAKKKKNKVTKNVAVPTTAQNTTTSGHFDVTIGQKVEVLDFCNIWRIGEVRLLDRWDKTVCIHYDGCDDPSEDEWFELVSGRLRPLKRDTTNTFKIPKADRAKQLALASSISQDNSLPNDQAEILKMTAKERKVPHFRKGTYVVATWVDGKAYPALVVRILSELSFLVEFNDGNRWALGSHCLTRTLSKTEYERLVENPEEAADILGPRIHNRAVMSPLQSPKDTAPPPRKRFRLTSPPAPPSSSKRKSTNQPTPLPNQPTSSGRNARRQSSAPVLGGSGSGFTSKASVRSVSPLLEQRRSTRKAARRSDSSDELLINLIKPQSSKKKVDDVQEQKVQITAEKNVDSENKRRVSTRLNKQPMTPVVVPSEKENVRKSVRQSFKKAAESEKQQEMSSVVSPVVLAAIPSKDSILDLVSCRPHSSLGFTSSASNVTISVEKTKTKVRFSQSDFSKLVSAKTKLRRGTRGNTRVSALKEQTVDAVLTQKSENRSSRRSLP